MSRGNPSELHALISFVSVSPYAWAWDKGIELVNKAFLWPQRMEVIKHVSVSLCFINSNSAADDQMATGHVL